MSRSIPLVFATQEAFRVGLEEHLGKGGAVLETPAPLPLQARVVVALELTFCRERILLDADIVQAMPGGVAVQFLEPADALRRRLVGFTGEAPPAEEVAEDSFADGDLFGAALALAEPPLPGAPRPAAARLDHSEVDLEPSDEPLPEIGEPGTGHAEPHLD
jgi:hypothetical protein